MKILKEHKVTIFSVFLVIVVLGFSSWISLRTSLLYDSRVADVNMYSYTLQADISSGQESYIYQEIAKEWLKFSEDYRESAKLRAYSALSSLWSLIFLAVTFPLLFSKRLFWIIPFGISVAFFILGLLIHAFSLDYSFLERVLSVFPVLHPELDRWNEITQIIENHEWLKICLEN